MNAERLHAIVLALNDELSKKNTVEKFGQVIAALNNVVNQSTPQHQQVLATSRTALYDALTDVPSDDFSPTWRQILVEIGADSIVGARLKETIQGIFAENQITPAVALENLRGLHRRLQSLKTALDNTASGFVALKVGDETLEPGQCELGILVPRQAVDNELKAFARELQELCFILDAFSEVATGTKETLSIKTISSTDLAVFLEPSLPLAACLAVAIERIVALYKQILEIRALRIQLSNQGVPAEQTKGIEDHANGLMATGIDSLAVEIVNEWHGGNDDGRRNELRNAVRISLNRIANRIDKGYNLEVRVQPIEPTKEPTAEEQTAQERIARIQQATPNMEFLKLEGPPILALPETQAPEDKSTPHPRSKKKK